jgi:hypothetical protein
MDYVALAVTLLKLFLIMYEKLQKTPPEERRKTLAEFDASVEKAKQTKDLRDLSKWFGRRL